MSRDLELYSPPPPRGTSLVDTDYQDPVVARRARRIILLVVVADVAVCAPRIYGLAIGLGVFVVGVVLVARALARVEVTAGVAIRIGRRPGTPIAHGAEAPGTAGTLEEGHASRSQHAAFPRAGQPYYEPRR